MPGAPNPLLILGVVPHQPDAVARQAAALASLLQARLVCATVDVGRTVVEEHPDGSVRSMDIDPDSVEASEEIFDPALQKRLGHILDPAGIQWEVRALAGDPATALARLAETLNAMLIIVGTRESGLRGSMHEVFNGSVAAHLAHRQHRPVVVIPRCPASADEGRRAGAGS